MSLATLLFGNKNILDDVEFDITLTEGAKTNSRITKNPVEAGADMNDHIIIDPMTYNVQGVVSNVSSDVLGQFVALASRFADRTKAQIAWEGLLALQALKEPFTLVQGLKSYDNVVISNLQEDQDTSTANALVFTANLTEINIVTTVSESATFGDANTSDGMASTTNGGLKQLG